MPPSLLSSLAASGFVVCWSSGFIGGRLAVEVALPPMALFAWRFALATLLVALWWRAWGTRSASRQGLFIEAGIGCLTMGGYLLGVMLAIQAGVGTAVTALITALQPLLATLLASLLLGPRSGGLRWLGMIIASVGVILCVAGDLGNADGAPLWAYGLPLLSVVSVTLGSILAARYPTAMAMDATLTAQLAAATGVFLIAALIEGHGRIALPALDSATLTAIGWLVFFSSLGATVSSSPACVASGST
ncbi:EamA-like transporter family protein [Modicisalibacter muralis]|uniref:EamA-like transporter family protein n=1 Tax=Modicisalibacter muralis TaxID=119000 RepID=A0A1G9NR09_9GAMM|nr:EamA family transporter [Halomonas muralis]SDL88435.1 EamA-like transporter family protein [Halomonas muralis]